MQPLGITYQQFLQICEPVDDILVDRFPSDSDFRTLLIERLQDHAPELARKIEGLEDDQIRFLRNQVVEHQKLVRWMSQ